MWIIKQSHHMFTSDFCVCKLSNPIRLIVTSDGFKYYLHCRNIAIAPMAVEVVRPLEVRTELVFDMSSSRATATATCSLPPAFVDLADLLR